ncbi:putative xanthine dehydrogenase subunit C [Weizmannia acidilactici]|uniref:Xanthine dehydrogenase subunit C n=1 Tax=Weizmannia acidilactici TaxID=2607726 RepID=A0A5J4JII1_9BACI|nr:FAD binding domain-containing protein [Weizmannia acidilactici]GER67099.1 putative xanthine dehydrogenase subunit C [Weizmannia acidilactici]GER70340.1 putative xanthine dehydrogenase subunit C [Weizmannia acidilactici]GER73585.1 putative xanthine dehydrogenase subunit C [Weizmannia acidilactici]
MAGQDKMAAVPQAVYRPASVEEAWALKQKFGGAAALIAGGTLLQMKREQGAVFPPCLISLEHIKELYDIHVSAQNLAIGSCVRLSDLRKNSLIEKDWHILHEAVRRVAAPAVRNRATIGGNVCYMSGDTIPALLSLGAKAVWFDGDYKTDDLQVFLQQAPLHPSCILTAILLPEPPAVEKKICFYQKIGRRAAFTPSLTVVSFFAGLTNENRVEQIRIAAGGGSSFPKRLTACEQFLKGKVLAEEVMAVAHEKIMEEYDPLPDAFATVDYRKKAASNLIVSTFISFLNGKDGADEAEA